MQSVVWLLLLVAAITVYSNLYGSQVDRIFWNLVSLITVPALLWMFSFTSASLSFFTRKVALILYGMVQFFVSRDKSWKTQPDPDLIKGVETVRTKRIIFIRHGESDWNLIFNKGILKMPFRFVAALIREIFMLFKNNSSFYDSPLNDEGIAQAKKLQFFIENPPADVMADPELNRAVTALQGTGEQTSILTVSNLRRAIATTCIGVWPRLQRTGEQVHILSRLQEISRNVDTLAMAPAKDYPECSRIVRAVGKEFMPDSVFDTSQNTGQKPLFGNGLTRLQDFAKWAINRDEDVIIVGGHSLYFRFFFKTFLPHHVDHVAKTAKIKNSGVIAFTLTEGKTYGKTLYRIEPESILNVYGGFAIKKKKKK